MMSLDAHLVDCAPCRSADEPCDLGARIAEREFRAEWWACKRKATYGTKRNAARHARKARQQSGHATIYAYQCRYCGKYHIGHNRELEGRVA